MIKKFKVQINTGKEENNKSLDIQQGAGDQGQPVRIKAQAGAKYQLQELGRNKLVGPDYVKVKRVGKHLHIIFENDNQASLIIEDYYSEMAPGYNGIIGQAENGSFYEYIPEDPRVPGLVPELAEGGQSVNVALGGAEVTPAGAAVAVAAFPFLGALGFLGGAAAIAAADNNNGSASTTPISGKLATVSDNAVGTANDNKTNDSTPLLTGTAPASSTATVTIQGQTYPVTVNADGTWSFTQPTNLPDGTYYPILNVTQNGSTTAVNLTPFTIDTTPPSIDVRTNAAALAAGESATVTFALSEPVADFSQNDVVVSGGTLSNFKQSTTDPRIYTATFTPNSTDTSASISVPSGKFTDAAGNANTDGSESNNSASMAINAKVTGALQPTAPNDSGGLGDNLTHDNTPTLAGKVPAGSTATITLNGQTLPATVNPDGSWTFTQPTGLPDGTYNPILNVITYGTSTSTPITPFTIDTVPPSIAMSSDLSTLVSGQTAKVTFALSEAVADFSAADIDVTGGNLSGLVQSATDPRIWTAVFTPNSAGTNASITFASAKFSDAAANFNTDGSEANNTLSFLTNASVNGRLTPASDNSTGAPNDNKTNDNTPELSGNVPAGSTAKVVINGQSYPVNVNPDGSWTFTQPSDLPDGRYTPELVVTDKNGNQSTTPITPFTIDTVAPTVAVSSPVTQLSAGESTTVTFTLSEHSGDFTAADLAVNGGTLGPLIQSANNPLVYSASFTATGANTTSVQIASGTFSDAAGNVNQDGADLNNTWSWAPHFINNNSSKTALSIDPIAADNVILLNEAGATSYAVTGKVTGKFAEGDVVRLTLNDQIYAGLAAADGSYRIIVPMSDLKADGDTPPPLCPTATVWSVAVWPWPAASSPMRPATTTWTPTWPM